MPNTLLDIAKINGSDAVVGLIEENLTYAPELSIFPARTIKGTTYKTNIRTTLPVTGFRLGNEGVAASSSDYKNVLVQAQIFGGTLIIDKAIAGADENGAEHLKAVEAVGVMRSALIGIGRQIWYGATNLGDAKGFSGIQSFADSTLTVDAGGTTAGTGTSIYILSFGNQDVTLCMGNETPFDLSPWREQLITDANGKQFDAWIAALTSWVGLQLVNKFSVVAIKNVTADAGKTATDSLISQALEKLPVGYAPSAIFMNRRSRGQLQRSRSVTIMSGAGGKATATMENVAPIPTEAFGVPIITTDSIVSMEALR